jgi:hypothetical protein
VNGRFCLSPMVISDHAKLKSGLDYFGEVCQCHLYASNNTLSHLTGEIEIWHSICCICTHCVSSLSGSEQLCIVTSRYLPYSFVLMSVCCVGGVVAPEWFNAKILSSQDFIANCCRLRRQQGEHREAHLPF